MAFRPGQSGNPGGRPKQPVDAVEMARALTPKAFEALDRALDDPERAVHAAQVILDRGWGRPPQAVYAQVNGSVLVGGIDRPPRESLEQWLERRRRELNALDGPRQEPVAGESAQPQPPSSPPNGEAAAQAEPPQAREAKRRGAADSAADNAGQATRSMTPQEADWLAIRRRELGIEPDDVRPNPAVKR